MKNETSRLGWIKYVAVAVGGYVLWTNRSKIQGFFKGKNLAMPVMPEALTDIVHNGTLKIKNPAAALAKEAGH